MKYQLNIRANEGYSADQVRGITAGELKRALDYLDDDDEIVTYDLNNPRGAYIGKLTSTFDPADEVDDIDEWLRNQPSN